MKYSKEELKEAYSKLPPDLREIILSDEITGSINDVGKKYNLHIDQIGSLDSETGLVLLGLTHPTEFVGSLTKRLEIDRVIASQIASDINDEVFLKVRDKLKDIQQKTERPDVSAEEEVADGSNEEKPAIKDEHPTRDALLAAIENPESLTPRPKEKPDKMGIPLVEIKNPYEGRAPEMGRDFPVVAPRPSSEPKQASDTPPGSPTPKSDILSQKLGGQVNQTLIETRFEAAPAKRVDPYKEQV